ncbi:MAG: glucose-1-phosphate adenylyltransferase subunit GlgD [Oscillospiraceae bacterium]|nr:glucose-1-phosphate adenylyltransferase subunit GlgD [Oscillospiraceae bacterium]
MNVMGIIFANDANMGDLADKRTMGSIPFGGRYRQVDFHLSNMAAAGIRHVGIISRRNYQSLINHIGSGEEWGLELEEGGLEFLTPYAMSASHSYRGKLENLYHGMNFLNYGANDEYVILADSAILANLDLNRILSNHIESGKDITVVTKAGIADGRKQLDLAIRLDKKGEVADLAVDYVAPKSYLASMDLFVISKTLLKKLVNECIARNLFHMDRDLILGSWQSGQISLNVYQFTGLAMFNETIEEYFCNSLALIDQNIRQDLFYRHHPVYTKVRDRVPSYYGEACQIDNCIVADGCMLEGTVSHSVLFRQVSVKEGCCIQNCLIMNDTVVGENCQLEYVILDKDVTVRPGSKLIGTPSNPIIIKRGEIV